MADARYLSIFPARKLPMMSLPKPGSATVAARRSCIGEDVTEQAEIEPARITVYRHVYPKYACPCCKDGVTSAPPAPSPIERGMAGPGLLAYVLVNKFSDHLPTYRQQDILTRHGFFVARSTLCDWLAQCAQGLESAGRLDARASAHVAGFERR